jgi:bifunctional enzyme Fae/Hps
MILVKKEHYLQIALNGTLGEAEDILFALPPSPRIIIEAGTPLIKSQGISVISRLRQLWQMRLGDMGQAYVVADLKTMDRAETEISMAKSAGANGVICLGQAPLETIRSFIKSATKMGVDSMVDMMNIEQPVKVLRQLGVIPDVVLLHRGVDEENFNRQKPIPYIQINKVLSSYNVLIAIGGGDSPREVQRAIFNGASIVVVWKEFYQKTSETGNLAAEFLKQIK